MPGIVGLVQSDGGDVLATVTAAARKLQHLDSLTMQAGMFGGVGVAQVWRDEPRADRDWHDEGDFAVRIAGHVMQDGTSPRRLAARDVAAAYRDRGRVPAEDYDGAFMVVVVDRVRRRVTVTNDRVGAFPVYFARGNRSLAFAPEVKAVLAAAGVAPRLRHEGVVSFLVFGYCLGPTTLFEGVTCLSPASTLSIDMDSIEHHAERYWNLQYQPSPSLRKRARAEDALYEALLASQRLVLCDQPASYEVLLSGGLDSRGVLALADVLGRPPAAALTWGATDAVPKSDAFVARQISDLYGVRHRFLAYETKDFVANARDWVYVSELANDNVGWFAEGQPTLASVYRSGSAFTIAGDVAWDSGGFAFNEMEMRRGVLPPDIPETLTACLQPGAEADCRQIYYAQIAGVLETCTHADLTDRKEYLYLNARVPRFVLSLGYYREHAVEVRRPFLTKAALDVFQSLPRNHRVEKNAYVSMMRRRFPRLMAIPEQSVWSLPDWESDLRSPGPLRDSWWDYLGRERMESGALGRILDGESFAARRDAFFSAPATAPWIPPFKARFPFRARVLPYVHRNRSLDRLSRLVRTGPGFLPRSDFDLMRCVVLVTMLEESLDRFGAASSR